MPLGMGPRWPGANANISRVAPGSAAAVIVATACSSAVQAADVDQEAVAAAEVVAADAGDVGVQEANVRLGLSRVAPGAVQRARDGVHRGHGPAMVRAVDGVAPGAAADVEHIAGRQGVGALDQAGQREGRLGVLPGGDSEAVHHSVGKAHGALLRGQV